MSTKYQRTPEEIAFDQLIDEQWDSLSEAARNVFRVANSAAHFDQLVDNGCLNEWEYDESMEKMRRAAAELTNHDLEQLTKIWCSALTAAASVDPYDYETIVGYRVYRAHLYRYYKMLSGMVETVEWEKRYAEDQKKELAEKKPIDDKDAPFRDIPF